MIPYLNNVDYKQTDSRGRQVSWSQNKQVLRCDYDYAGRNKDHSIFS